jgi:hypothetical protein
MVDFEKFQKNSVFFVKLPFVLGFVSCVSVLPLILMERQSEMGSGMDAVMNAETGAKIREITHGGAKYHEAMKYNLKCFDQIGVLD